MEISGWKVSFTDLWGLIVEYFLQQKVKEFTFGCVLLFVLCFVSRNQLLSTFVSCCGVNIGSSHVFLPRVSQHPSLVTNFEII